MMSSSRLKFVILVAAVCTGCGIVCGCAASSGSANATPWKAGPCAIPSWTPTVGQKLTESQEDEVGLVLDNCMSPPRTEFKKLSRLRKDDVIRWIGRLVSTPFYLHNQQGIKVDEITWVCMEDDHFDPLVDVCLENQDSPDLLDFLQANGMELDGAKSFWKDVQHRIDVSKNPKGKEIQKLIQKGVDGKS